MLKSIGRVILKYIGRLILGLICAAFIIVIGGIALTPTH